MSIHICNDCRTINTKIEVVKNKVVVLCNRCNKTWAFICSCGSDKFVVRDILATGFKTIKVGFSITCCDCNDKFVYP